MKKNYFKTLCQSAGDEMPALFKDLGRKSSCDELIETEDSRRLLENSMNLGLGVVCRSNITSISEEDLLRVNAAIKGNDEAFLLMDKDGNNYLESAEVEVAYDNYSPFIDLYLSEQDSPALKRSRKDLYLFLMKYQEIPGTDFRSTARFMKFMLSPNKNQMKLNRADLSGVGAALTEIVVKYDPNFACESAAE
jgi:hypothetical protein